MSINFVIGPYQPDDAVEVWNKTRNERPIMRAEDVMNGNQGSDDLYLMTPFHKINNAPAPCAPCSVNFNGAKRSYPNALKKKTIVEIFKFMDSVKKWPWSGNTRSWVHGYRAAKIYKQNANGNGNGNGVGNPDHTKRQGGWLRIFEVEKYMEDVYGNEYFESGSEKLKFMDVILSRFEIRIKALLKEHGSPKSLRRFLMCFYGVDKYKELRDSVEGSMFPKVPKTKMKHFSKMWGNDEEAVLKVLFVYLVETMPQVWRSNPEPLVLESRYKDPVSNGSKKRKRTSNV